MSPQPNPMVGASSAMPNPPVGNVLDEGPAMISTPPVMATGATLPNQRLLAVPHDGHNNQDDDDDSDPNDHHLLPCVMARVVRGPCEEIYASARR
jgi:hypothetical protein